MELVSGAEARVDEVILAQCFQGFGVDVVPLALVIGIAARTAPSIPIQTQPAVILLDLVGVLSFASLGIQVLLP